MICQCQRVVHSSAAHSASRPGSLSLQRRRAAKAAKNPGPKPRAPAGPCNGKQMAGPLTAAGCSQQSRRGNFSFAVIHHRAGSGRRRGGGKTEQRLTPDVWPLSNAFAWHIHGSHSYTHVKTHTQTQTSENILAHVPVPCLSLVVLFFSAPGRL